jgi:chromosome segregation ATPase
MTQTLVTRRVLARELALNAATRPLNVIVPVGLVVAAILLTFWLLPVAAVVYAALVVTTFLDGEVAESVGRKVYATARGTSARAELSSLTPAVADRLALAREADQRVRNAIAESPIPLADVETEVERLMHELEKLAHRANRVATYLAEESEVGLRRRLHQLRRENSGDSQLDAANAQAAAALEDQLHARAQLARQLSHFDAQVQHIVATLGFIHAQIVRMSVAEEASLQHRVADQVRDLRHEVDAIADALHQAYRELD